MKTSAEIEMKELQEPASLEEQREEIIEEEDFNPEEDIEEIQVELTPFYKRRIHQIMLFNERLGERFAAVFRLVIMGLLAAFAVLAYIQGRPFLEFLVQVVAVSILILYSLSVLYILRKQKYYRSFYKYVSVFLEITFLSGILGFLAYYQNNATMIYTAAMVYIYFIFIALSTTRNNNKVIIFSVVLTMVEYGALIAIFYSDMPGYSGLHSVLSSIYSNTLDLTEWGSGRKEIVSLNLFSSYLKLTYIITAGFLLVVGIRNSRRSSEQISSLIYNTEKEVILKEKEKSDHLLLNILPKEVANELKEKGITTPHAYKNVTILFTDFKGFTMISEKLTPEELVDELNLYFKYFDRMSYKYNLEKLKTIGDAYMCAGGLPEENNTHPIDAILGGMDILDFMKTMKEKRAAEGKQSWELRLGIHTGSVMAGVVGIRKFAYDIWGDAVNTASRCESSGEPGRINISGDTYNLIKDFFECEYRGKVKAKNKGDIDMYFVNGIKKELSENGEGKIPNENFIDMYAQLQKSGHLT